MRFAPKPAEGETVPEDTWETETVAPLSELCGATIMNGPYRLLVIAK